MKYMLLVYLDENSLSEVERAQCYQDSAQLACELSTKGKYLASGPLHPTTTATSVRVREGKRLVTDGPFAETRELVAGYWVWKVNSIEEAVDWLKRAPFDGGAEVEIRPIFEAEDFGAEFTPELREQEDRIRAEAAKLKENK